MNSVMTNSFKPPEVIRNLSVIKGGYGYHYWLAFSRKPEENLETRLSIRHLELFLLLSAVILFVIKQWRQKKESGKGKQRELPVVRADLPSFLHFDVFESFYNLFRCNKDGLVFLDFIRSFGHFNHIPMGWTRFYTISDPDIVQKIVTSTDPNHLNKSKFFYDKIFQGAFNDGLVAADANIWAPHRKILSRAFTFKSLQSYLGIMNSYTKRLTKKLLEAANESESDSIGESDVYYIEYCHTLRIISNIVMGAEILAEDEYREFSQHFRRYKQLAMFRTLNPWFMIDLIWWFHPKRRELNRALNYFYNIFEVITKKYKEKRAKEKEQGITWIDPEDNEVGLKPFRCMLEEMLHSGMNEKEIRDEVLTFLIAGHETTTVATNIFMFHLALNPEIQEMCRQEIDTLFASKMDNSDDEIDFTIEDFAGLKYLERCILESLRITPTIPIFLRRMDAPLKLDDGYEIEAGKNVFIIPWNLHRNEKYFPDPMKFDPDRFLPENCTNRHQYAFLPFSGGLRNCIGWKMSMIEMKMIIVRILRNFKILTNDTLDSVKFLFDVTLLTEKEINLTLKKR